MKHHLPLLILLAVLTGCAGQTTSQTATAVPTNVPVLTAAAASTVTPAAAQPPTPAYPSPLTLAPTEAYPPASIETTSPGYPYPAAQGLLAETALPSAQPGVPFQDCARTPGLAGCDTNPAPLTGSLAFFDASAGRLVSLDLRGGAGWQVPLGSNAPAALDWSPDGKNLLVEQGSGRYTVYTSQGKSQQTFALPADAEIAPAWQPDGTLSKDGSVHAADGSTARLDYSANDMRWTLTVKPAGGAERTLPVAQPGGDILYKLLSWIPGMQNLLAQSYYASNQAMTQGGQLVSIDTSNGAVRPWNARMDLGQAGMFAWNPTKPNLLALLETGDTGVTAPRLALLDLKTGQVSYPLPDGVLVSGLAWQPGGEKLAFSARTPQGASSDGASKDAVKMVPGLAIYLLDLSSGKVNTLVQSPAGAVDGWPHWSADGSLIVYARAIGETAQVRAHRLADGQDWVLVDGLTGVQQRMGSPAWNSLLAFSGK